MFEFCSGLVDLVECVPCDGRSGHHFALAGERFVGRVAQDITQVGDRSLDLGECRRGDGANRVTGDGGRRFVVSEPVQEGGEDSQGADDVGGARVVIMADRHSEVIESGQRVTGFGFEAGQTDRQVCLVGAVAAVVSDHQAPAQGVQRAPGIGVPEREPAGEKRERERIRVTGGFGGVDQTVRGGTRLVTATGDRQCECEG